uniref:Uncharacterized protein n=1 Tax=Acanthochromis polyacanthus TaxID=80966 RepID=A0A3Q1FPG3_9TELE
MATVFLPQRYKWLSTNISGLIQATVRFGMGCSASCCRSFIGFIKQVYIFQFCECAFNILFHHGGVLV